MESNFYAGGVELLAVGKDDYVVCAANIEPVVGFGRLFSVEVVHEEFVLF